MSPSTLSLFMVDGKLGAKQASDGKKGGERQKANRINHLADRFSFSYLLVAGVPSTMRCSIRFMIYGRQQTDGGSAERTSLNNIDDGRNT